MSSSLYIDAAYEFYATYINNKDFYNKIREHGLNPKGSVPPITWELFGSILTGQKGNGSHGADLRGWEVKSAIEAASFEYQYHLNTGAEKLQEDMAVNHLFCSYSPDYQHVTVRVIHGSQLAHDYFQKWVPKYHANYQSTDPALRRQRFRKSIPYGFVQKIGTVVLSINNGVINYRIDR